jgi:hypothetical protein
MIIVAALPTSRIGDGMHQPFVKVNVAAAHAICRKILEKITIFPHRQAAPPGARHAEKVNAR